MRCAQPGSLGRHVLGDPDWAGRRVCDCGRVRRLPPGTHALPERWPVAELVDRLFADAVIDLDTFAADCGITLQEAP